MDFIKAQLERIQQQLNGLNASQKMLTAALVAIMLLTVVWWGKYAGEAELVPLINQSLAPADIGHMQDALAAKGIVNQVTGDKILVHADRRMEALSALTFARAMPHVDDGFKDLLTQMNPFDSVTKDEKLWNHHKQTFLSQVIGGMKGVAKAYVVIDPTSVRRIDGNIEPSATVSITLEDTGVRDRQKLVDAAAALLAGSQAGLAHNRITVVVNGVVQRVHDAERDDLASSSDQLEYRERNESYEEKKVIDAFPYIRQLAVKVTVALNTTTVQSQKTEYDAKNAISKPVKTSEETEETTGAAPQPAGESGAVPNMGLQPQAPATPVAAAAGPTQSRTRTDDSMQNFIPTTNTTSKTPAGSATPTGATVRIPYSYFVSSFKKKFHADKDPDDKQLQPAIAEELASMQKAVANLLSLQNSIDKVSIATYADVAPELDVQPATAGSSMSGVSVMVGGHAKEIALGTLAVMSLFMASMMVRKGTPAAVPAAAAFAPPPQPTVLPGESFVGEAASGGAALDGMELNDDAIKAQQMVEQVSTLVRDNPDAAASLVKRWLNRN